jgi:hypothetical protein
MLRESGEVMPGRARARLSPRLAGAGDVLASTLAGAPSIAVARLLWRTLDAAWRDATRGTGTGLAVTVCAVPLIIVTGVEKATGEDTIPGVLADPGALATILMAHGSLAGNRSLALANALVGADAIDIAQLPRLLEWQRLFDATARGSAFPERTLAPAPLALRAGGEGVHLRFLVGTAIARPDLDLLADANVGKWGIALTQELTRQLGGNRHSVLALPRAPQNPLRALQQDVRA